MLTGKCEDCERDNVELKAQNLCSKCYQKQYMRKHRASSPEIRAKENAYAKTYHSKNKKAILERHKQWTKDNAEHVRQYASRRCQELKQKAFELLGGPKCVNCGFSDHRALQIDHINNDGHIERKNNKTGKRIGAMPVSYLKIINTANPKDKYQVLCANCNWIKEYERRTCWMQQNMVALSGIEPESQA